MRDAPTGKGFCSMHLLFIFSRRIAWLALLALTLVSVPEALADNDKEWKEWEKDRREAIREAEKERREWEKDRRKAIKEQEKDRREAAREWEKDRREAAREAAKDRRGRDYGRYGDWDHDNAGYRGGVPYGQNRDWRGTSTGRLALSQGYRDGFEKGREDWRKRRPASLERHERYRDADRGYKSEYGDKFRYRLGYRDGFEQGYNEGYMQY